MGITASYRQISEFEYASFRRSPLKAYQSMLGTGTNIRQKLQDFADWAALMTDETKAIQNEYSKTGLYDRLGDVDFDPTRLSKEDRLLFEEQKAKLDTAHKKHARATWHQFSVDKAWQAIHFLLTGQIDGGRPPLALAVFGGLELADQQNYTAGRPFRILSPEQVKEIDEALAGISADHLLSRATIAEMVARNVYAVSEDEAPEREYIRIHYEGLQRFYADAAQKRNGMLLSLT
jgi:hypothetical protein